MNSNNIKCFNSFGVEYILKDIKKFIVKKNIIIKIYRIQAYNSIMCVYFCAGFIHFMLKGKSLLDYKNVFSLNNYLKKWQNNTKIYSVTKKMKKFYSIIWAKYR